MDDIFGVMMETAMKSGELLKKYFYNRDFEVDQKTISYDLVTNADRESQELIISSLSSKFPHIPILGEEGMEIKKYERAFFVDPLDGTLNFVHGISMFCVSIGYWEDGNPKVGVVYAPILGELFFAKEGEGAYLNGKRIHTSSPKSLKDALLVTGWPYDKEKLKKAIKTANKILDFTEFRAFGSAALELCYVAMGIFDGYWEYGLYPWDLAAGVLIAKEGGAIVRKPDGEEFDLFEGEVLAISPHIYDEFLRVIKE
ncbi:MAG: inositol monophosphatase [Dictyoglomus sp. NZ13-RE01]|nr:MAG: inositol monophosphatase [Dictyoglomus sp. NZ13-RE01]